MATRFEFVLLGDDVVRMRAAGEEALAEVGSLEKRLSFYDPSSELSRINRRAAERPVAIAPDVFDLIHAAKKLSDITGGSFDPTIAPLMRCWGFVGDSGHHPEERELSDALRLTGMHNVLLDTERKTIEFSIPGVELDLGGIAKGFAIDEAASILRSSGIERALLHGGTSSIIAIGESFDAPNWKVGIVRSDESILGTVELSDCSMSVSAVSGKAFHGDGTIYGHVIDPRTGEPAKKASLATVVADSATVSDALSTAALLLGTEANIISEHCAGWGVDSISGDRMTFVHDCLPGYKPLK